VLGVAITLSVGIWINNAKDKKDLKLYLNAIKIELEDNLKNFEKDKQPLELAVKYGKYLNSKAPNSLHQDTIINNFASQGGVYFVKKYTTKRNAFEMLKNSGLMRLIEDKDILLFLWDTYTKLDNAEFLLNEFIQFKKDEMVLEMHNNFNAPAPLYNFYTQSMVPNQMLIVCNQAIELLKIALSRFDEIENGKTLKQK
jgi:hypothetical protein